MSKTKNKPGIHLYQTSGIKGNYKVKFQKEWYWHIVSKNGRIIARRSETYSRKSGAVKSIKVVKKIFGVTVGNNSYYDHTKPNSPLQSYL
jgi:uncharacterized protein YegP (UPF0339 family)